MAGVAVEQPVDPLGGSALPGRQIIRGITQSLAGRALTAALQFATLVVLARALGPDGLGEAQFSFVIFTYLILFNDPGLTVMGTREHGRAGSRLTAAGTLLGARLALSVPLIGVIALVALGTTGRLAPGAAVPTILALATVVCAFSLRWLLLARHSFGVVALCELTAAALQLGGAALVYVLDLGAVAGLAVLVGGPVTLAALTYLKPAMDGRLIRPSFDRDIARLVRMAIPLGVAAIATGIYYSVDSLLIGLTRTSGELGIYAAAYRIVLAGLMLPVIVHGVALPVVSKVIDTDRSATDRVIRGLSGWLMVVALPAATTVAVLARELTDVIYGPSFERSALPLSILVWSLVTVSANVPFAVLMLASRRDRAYLGITVLGVVVNVSLNILLIPAYGYLGAAVTTMISEVVVLASFVWLTRPLAPRVLARTIPLGLVPAVVVVLLLTAAGGPLIVRLALAVAGSAGAVLLLAALGAMRESLAMLERPGA